MHLHRRMPVVAAPEDRGALAGARRSVPGRSPRVPGVARELASDRIQGDLGVRGGRRAQGADPLRRVRHERSGASTPPSSAKRQALSSHAEARSRANSSRTGGSKRTQPGPRDDAAVSGVRRAAAATSRSQAKLDRASGDDPEPLTVEHQLESAVNRHHFGSLEVRRTLHQERGERSRRLAHPAAARTAARSASWSA